MSFKLLLPAVLAVGFNLQAAVIFDTITGAHQIDSAVVGDHPVELGDHISFAGTDRNLASVSVLFNQGDLRFSGQYTTDFTLRLYYTDQPDSLLIGGEQTVSQLIKETGVFQVNFDFGFLKVPDSLYYSVSVASRDTTGPADSLSLVLWNENGSDGPVTVGTDLDTHNMNERQIHEVKGTFGTANADGLTGAIQFNTVNAGQDVSGVPEPGTFALLGLGLVGIAVRSRRK